MSKNTKEELSAAYIEFATVFWVVSGVYFAIILFLGTVLLLVKEFNLLEVVIKLFFFETGFTLSTIPATLLTILHLTEENGDD